MKHLLVFFLSWDPVYSDVTKISVYSMPVVCFKKKKADVTVSESHR